MKKLSKIIIVLLSFISCSSSQSVESKQIDFEYTILKYNRKEHEDIFKNGSPTSLTDSEIIEIEQIVGNKIRQTIKSHNKDVKTKHKFYRQYVPVINGMGEKEVFVQCFAEYYFEDSSWKEYLVRIADGGSSVFSLWVNLNSKTSNGFSIHGEG
ncbi:hypothetical protein [Flavobacterium mekongense]|uniref:hypothetical protein n=1 Tax=Flavobacterium mekongense TaxID=3379707 RepID=UPI00399B70E5